HAEAGAHRPGRRLARQRGDGDGVEGDVAGRPIDDADVENHRVARGALLARRVEQVGEQRDGPAEIARQAGGDDRLQQVTGRPALADGGQPGVEVEAELPGQVEAGQQDRAEVRLAGAEGRL